MEFVLRTLEFGYKCHTVGTIRCTHIKQKLGTIFHLKCAHYTPLRGVKTIISPNLNKSNAHLHINTINDGGKHFSITLQSLLFNLMIGVFNNFKFTLKIKFFLYNIDRGFLKKIRKTNQTVSALNYYNAYLFKSNAKTLESLFSQIFLCNVILTSGFSYWK